MRYSLVIFIFMLFGCAIDNPVELTIVNLEVDLNPSKTERAIILRSHNKPGGVFSPSYTSLDTFILRKVQRDTTFAFYNDRADKFTILSNEANYLDTFDLIIGTKNDIRFTYNE